MATILPPDAGSLIVPVQPPPPEVLDAIARLHAACKAWPRHSVPSEPGNSGLTALIVPDQPSAICAGPYDAAVIGAGLGAVLALMLALAVFACNKAIHAPARSRAADLFFYVTASVAGAFVVMPVILVRHVFQTPARNEVVTLMAFALGAAGWRWLHQRLSGQAALLA